MKNRENEVRARARVVLRGGLFVGSAVLLASPVHAAWSLNDALMPNGVSLEVEHRTRYEYLDDEFRAARDGSSKMIAHRTLVDGRVELPQGFTVGAELEDSRAEQTGNTNIDTTHVNAVELLRAYLEFDRGDVLGGRLNAQAGRITMDVGSRRLVARNRFRNTINGFTGIDVDWKAGEESHGLELRAFWALPVQREPTPGTGGGNRIRDDDIVFDTESFDFQFWGLFVARDFSDLGRGEIYLFGMHESDDSDRPSRNRELYTPGFRLSREPAKQRFDHVVETAVQFGKSRSSTTRGFTTGKKLDHLAHFHHLTVGYTFDVLWTPRLAFQYDFASGDGNPNDGSNGRFDTLFGARRFDFGPTGIYGAFARANLHTPGLRLEVKPHAQINSFVAVRSFWLASKQDAWTTSGVSDPRGSSDDYVGTQAEVRVQWDVIPKNVRLEAGYAHLFAGEFVDDAPNSNRQGDSNYVYSQIVLGF